MLKENLEESQLVLCTVEKIAGTSVFVKLDDYGVQGTITFPEISPGRIRNIREFVVPGKKIVCKVLAVKPDTVELSLRRVKTNERIEFNELHKKEKSYIAMLKIFLGNKAEKVIEQIKNETSLVELFDSSRDNPKILERYISKKEAEKILKALEEKRPREVLISKRFSLSSKASNGIVLVKNILKEASKGTNAEFSYIMAGKYFIKIKSKDPKNAESEINKILEAIENSAKKNSCIFIRN